MWYMNVVYHLILKNAGGKRVELIAKNKLIKLTNKKLLFNTKLNRRGNQKPFL